MSTQFLIGIYDFIATVVVSAFGVYFTFRVFITVNPDYDSQDEILADNRGVAILLAGIMIGAGEVIQKGIYPVVQMMRLYLANPDHAAVSGMQLVVYSLANVVLAFVLAVVTISMTLRLFGRLTREGLHPGKELKKGNVSMGILLAAVVLTVSLFIGEGVSSLSKALIPQPSIGRIQVMK